MPDGRLCRLLTRFTDIRPNEARLALGFFCYFFLITLSIYIVKPVKENFLIGITPAWWPYADFITAGLIGFVVTFNDRFIRRLPRRGYFSYATIFFASSLFILWCIFEAKLHSGTPGLLAPISRLTEKIWPSPVFVFSFWTDIFIVTSMTHFWFAVNDIFSLHQAKRIVSFFVTGGLLGGIAGSLLTSLLVHAIGPVNLMLVCPAIFLLNLGVIRGLYADHRKGGRTADFSQTKPTYWNGLRAIRDDKYLRVLAGFFASAVVMASLINYQFKIVIKEAIPNDGARTSFLGRFFLIILLLSAIFHLLTTGQVLKRFGIRPSLLMAPTILLLGSLAVFIVPVPGLILWACVIRGCEKTFDCTISQSVRELLYMPIPPAIKYQAKIYIDMFVNKLAVGFGALLFWVLYRAGSFSAKSTAVQVRLIGIFAAVLSLVCIILVWNIYMEYLGAVKKDLSRKWQDAHRVLADQVDLEAARLVVDTLQSRERSSTLYAMNLFQLIRKDKLSPELMANLAYKEDELKANSIDSLLEVPGHVLFREIEDVFADKSIVSEVRDIVALESYQSIMEKRLGELIRDEKASEVERMEAAKLIGILKATPAVRRCLDKLLQDASPEVLVYALDSAAVHRLGETVPRIVRLLENPVIRHVAQDTLACYGAGIEEILGAHLHDMNESLNTRSSIPDILARIETQKSADALSAELIRCTEDLKQCMIDALYKIRSNRPDLHFKKKRIMAAVFSRIGRGYEISLAGYESQLQGSTAEPGQNWRTELERTTKQVFDLLTLIYPAEDIIRAYQNILQGTRKSIDSSFELLDNVLDRDLKMLLFPIIEDLPPEDKTRRLRRLRRNLDKYLH